MSLPSAASIILPFVVLLVSIITKAQRLPSTRDESLFILQMSNPETFYDSRLLPDGAEVRVSIDGDNPRYSFLMVEEDSTAVSITVTPCQASLQWELSIHDLPEDGSGSSEDDQLSDQRPQKKPPIPKAGTLLKNYTGYDAVTYTTYNSPSGLYVLKVSTPADFASFRIYTTTSAESDHGYPELPHDPRLDITAARRNKVSLAWKASPSDILHRQPIKYCVAMSTRKNYHTWCSVEALVNDDDDSDIIPTNSGFGFEIDREIRRNLRKKKRKSKRKGKAGRDGQDNLVVECVGSKTLHTFTNLQPGTKYYFDLFAVDQSTNRSVTYLGTSIVTREPKQEKTIKELKDAKLTTSAVRRSRPVKIFTFAVGEVTSDVLITIQPCTWPIVIEVYRADEREQIRSSRVRNLKNFTIKNVEGKLKIKIKGVQKRTSHFRLFATTKESKYPFPSLPEDHRIKVFENLRECSSITVAWLTTSEVAQYCLYMRKDPDQSPRQESSSELLQTDNYCHAPEMRKKTEKIICRLVNGADADMDVLTETITGLEENTKYIFDVYISSYGKQTLAYRSAKAKTKKRC